MAFTPTDPTKAEVRITGTAPNQALDFYIPRGAKGEPGGWTASIVIATGTSLNDVVTSGLYLNPQSNVANGPSNSTNGGHLEVIATAGYVYQRYTPIAETRETYVRYRTSGLVWSAWSAFNTTRVDQTAGRAIYQWDDLNNREQLVYGDTGWRRMDIPADSYTINNGIDVRRMGNVVHMRIIDTTFTTQASVNPIFTLPAGFRIAVIMYFPIMEMSATATPGRYTASIHAPGDSTWPSGVRITKDSRQNLTANIRLGGYISWVTDDAWPTTLPGTAVGSIPNL